MKKKIFTLLTLLLCVCSGAWADPVTIGLKQINDGVQTVNYKGTLAAPAYNSTTHANVAKDNGTLCEDNQSGRKTTGPDGDYTCSKCFRKLKDNNEGDAKWMAQEWVGYTITVESGYKMSLSNIKATLWDANSSATYAWRVIIENPSGEALYTSEERSSSTSSIGTLTVASPSNVANLSAGTYTVKLQIYQGGGNKYFTVPYLTVDANVEEDATPSYAMTAAVDNEAHGTAEVSEASVLEGNSATFTATSKKGYKFVNWTNTLGGAEVSTDNPYTIASVNAPVSLTANFTNAKSITYSVTESQNGTRTDNFGTDYADDNDKFVAPGNLYLSNDNKTLTGWNDGSATYNIGDEIDCSTGNKTLSPVFDSNSGASFAETLESRNTDFTVTWNMGNDYADFNVENKTAYYVQQATINGDDVDIPMFIDAHTNYSTTGGKVNNVGKDRKTFAQTNKGTIFRIPVINGSVVTINTYAALSTTTINGSTEYEKTNSDKTGTYTYSGETGTIDIVMGEDNQYTYYISVKYPDVPSIVAMPTATRTGYSVTWEGDDASKTTISSSDKVMNGYSVYEIKNGKSVTLTIPTTTMVSKIKVWGTSKDNNASTLTITGANEEKASGTFADRRKANTPAPSQLIFEPTTQTTTYTIKTQDNGSWVIIEVYGTENVAKIGETKWGTFSSTSATTFPVDGISAYKVASIGADKVVVEPVTGDVPANTGLLLYGNAGEYTIPVASTDGSPVDGNLMTAGTGENVTSGYVLSGLHGDFRPVPTSGVVVPYGKAYLSIPNSTRSLSIAFDDETTGINSVESENNGLLNGDFYNVAGQRVAKPTKGLYIVNGKKVIIK